MQKDDLSTSQINEDQSPGMNNLPKYCTHAFHPISSASSVETPSRIQIREDSTTTRDSAPAYNEIFITRMNKNAKSPTGEAIREGQRLAQSQTCNDGPNCTIHTKQGEHNGPNLGVSRHYVIRTYVRKYIRLLYRLRNRRDEL